MYLEGVVVPHTVERGNTAVLECKFQVKYFCTTCQIFSGHMFQENFHHSLYSLKWYKDEVEFYRLDIKLL